MRLAYWKECLSIFLGIGSTLAFESLDAPAAPRSVSGVAGTGSSRSSGVKLKAVCLASPPCSSCVAIRGFLFRRCRLASSAASLMDGTDGESSVCSRFRRPDTARMAGFWARFGRLMRFGVANTGGPLKDSTFLSVPFDDRRESCRTLCCENIVS